MIRDWLSPVGLTRSADLIFVFAGREYRKRYGLELLRRSLAPRILFSVARFEIRSFSKLALPLRVDLLELASKVPPPERHYFVEFENQAVSVELVRPRRFGTLNETDALRRWLISHPEIRSVLVISSAMHLRRVKMCCQALLPVGVTVSLLGAPVESLQRVARIESAESAFEVATELFKVAVYWLVLRLPKYKLKVRLG